jgi:hypothetical protein
MGVPVVVVELGRRSRRLRGGTGWLPPSCSLLHLFLYTAQLLLPFKFFSEKSFEFNLRNFNVFPFSS